MFDGRFHKFIQNILSEPLNFLAYTAPENNVLAISATACMQQ